MQDRLLNAHVVDPAKDHHFNEKDVDERGHIIASPEFHRSTMIQTLGTAMQSVIDNLATRAHREDKHSRRQGGQERPPRHFPFGKLRISMERELASMTRQTRTQKSGPSRPS
jgi:hypothetical protein